MTTLATGGQYTLLELAKRTHDGDHIEIVNTLTEDNPILQHAPWQQANNIFSHVYTKVLAMPSGSWRAINEGVALEAAQTVQATETLAMLESRAEVDTVLIDNAPNPKAARMDEAMMFLEGMSQTFADCMFYGNNGTEPKKFTGLAPRLNSASAANFWNAGGSGSDTTSIFIVQWDPRKCFMLYPKGHKRHGIDHKDLGIESVTDSGGTKKFRAYVDMFGAWMGLCVKDERHIARVGNIEITGASNLFDENYLIKALNEMPQMGKGAKIYVNSTLKSIMDIALKDKANVNFTTANGLGGVDVLQFKGREVVVCDAIVNTETVVT